MILVYAHYIKYHWDCIRRRFLEGCKLLRDKKCNRRFNEVELLLSVMELLGKDNIQSGILIWMCISQPILTPPSWQFITFSVFSVLCIRQAGRMFRNEIVQGSRCRRERMFVHRCFQRQQGPRLCMCRGIYEPSAVFLL